MNAATILEWLATPSFASVLSVLSSLTGILGDFGLLWWVVVFVAFLAWLFNKTWMHYLAIMNLQRAKNEGKLSGPSRILGSYNLVKGLFFDWLLNVFLSIPFLNLPASWGELVTGRLKRYAYGPAGWRRSVALWLAGDFLDDFDPRGKHV